MIDSIFQHGVASGDPLQDRVILWTRLTSADQEDLQLAWAIASDPDFTQVVASGTAVACADDDHTIHVDVTGLQPGRRYFYRFHALGQTSPVGRTKTLPPNEVRHVRFAQASGARFDSGFFNAYARIADHDDLDFVLHLGDYIYETADLPPAEPTRGPISGRLFEPLHECKTLQDYRQRYSQYHKDPDLQRMRAALPIVSTLADHELAEGAWRGGADLHDPRRDGAWSERVQNALRARREWMPVRLPDPSDQFRVYRSVHVGSLADIFLLDTRVHRDQPIPPPEMHDPNRSALGLAQRRWLFEELELSTAAWRIVGSPSLFGSVWRRDLPDSARTPLQKIKLLASDGLGPGYDQWDGYTAERYLLTRRIRDHKHGNFLILSGGAHIGLAHELKMDPAADPAEKAIAVECVNSSTTSPNFDDKMKWEPRSKSLAYEQELMEQFPEMKYLDLDSHGYTLVDVTPDRALLEWWCVDTVLERTEKEHRGAAFRIEADRPVLLPAP